MELAAIRIFVKVAEFKGVSAAARALSLPKSTVSRTLSQLEERLGLRLVHRTTRGLSLTGEGQTFLRHAQRIVTDVEEAEQELAAFHGQPRGVLRMTAPYTLGMLFLGPALPRFLSRHPEVQVVLDLTGRMVDLVEEGFDLALRVGPLVPSSLMVRQLGSNRPWLCASPAYLKGGMPPAHPRELPGYDMLELTAAVGAVTRRLSGPEGDMSVTLHPRLAVNDPGVLRDSVLAGMGLSWLPPLLVAEDVRQGRLVRLLPEWAPPVTEYHALFPSSRGLSPKVRAFLDFLVEEIAEPLRRAAGT
ncbi:LysR family transcriptional regulator [Paramagnetospirillum caucaseum]|uniref:LysR family transcriptional regulator n=1 Tax=Paramagnetospirillum caucaseum TaxID=1244869 RepID=M3AFG0_9PROT|nr:LysR family transcriptional regulator [Paramagnetospirillum caucaseum]EME71568.1 LysR family transcriptional regulator [Paramagnetospirillum caucaseum]